MTPKRTIVVAVAVAVGVAASVLSYVFLNNAQQRAYHNAKLVQAYVVVKPVPATLDGTDGDQRRLHPEQEDPEGVPSGVGRDQAVDHREQRSRRPLRRRAGPGVVDVRQRRLRLRQPGSEPHSPDMWR